MRTLWPIDFGRSSYYGGSYTGLAVTGEAGFDYLLTERLGTRVQVDVPIDAAGPTLRVLTGIVWAP